ncbi:hypothetical protein WJX81_006430 [Elliptochloris bilobata]|uniref:RanBD1 domain-containing protein n=1 Tax=Elliptochloris bilobata TaxID=381761 RepID=A0AAW1RAV4_9CHLO
MSKRPTDHLEPSAKKRTNNKQLTKDDASEEDGDEVDPGTFQRASEDVLKARRIVRTRRNAPASVAASANPFSGVSLGMPSVQSASASNPVNSVSDSVPRKASEEAEQAPAAPGPGAGFGFGAGEGGALGNGNAFGALGSTTAGAETFGFGASAASAAAAGSEAAPDAQFRFQPAGRAVGAGGGFSFATAPASAGFPSVQSIFGSSGPAAATSLFGGTAGSGGGRATPAVALAPEEARVTGEEAERAAFSGDGVLYEFGEGQWRERGRGELRVNVAPAGQARLVMRQRGNLRLLLNANLWPEMKVTLMDGGKGVTFACVNATKAADCAVDKGDAAKPAEGGAAEAEAEEKKDGEADAVEEPKQAEEAKLATFAFRVKERARLDEFTEAVEANKAGPKAADAKV